jgi:serum/glucocorticoid-regulated kinase 2|tara:strand:- start:447 stop:653 length:207 start_codon:yes stop_codon:yes gene_type:complete
MIACLTIALEYIHQNCIIHRDIKPENLVFDKNGYMKVTDFGIAKHYERENSSETSGTPSYMAPEVIFK